MKKYFCSLLILFFSSSQIRSQQFLAAAKKDSLWGFIDETGKTVIDFQYNFAYNFSCGRALVKKHSQWKYITISNTSISEGKGYICLTDFSYNRAVVRDPVSNKEMLIDTKGDVVFKSQETEDIQCFYKGLARVKIYGLYGFIDTNGVIKIPAKYSHAGRFGGSNDSPLAPVKQGEAWLFVTTNGKEIIPPPGFEIRDYNYLYEKGADIKPGDTDLLLVRSYLKDPVDDKLHYAYMNRKGEIILPALFVKAENFYNGLAAYSKDGKTWGYMNSKGEIIIPEKQKWARNFSEGIAISGTDNKIYIRKDGTALCNEKSTEAKFPFINGFAKVEKDKLYGFIDSNCQLRVPVSFNKVRMFSHGFVWVQTGTKWAVCDANGKLVTSALYSDNRPFVPVQSNHAEGEEEGSAKEE